MTTQIHAYVRADWITDAACHGYPTGWWFSDDLGDQARARIVCHRCPVRDECLEAALCRDEYGMWGGYTQRERVKMLGQRPVTKQLVCAQCKTQFEREARLRGHRLYCSKACRSKASMERHTLWGDK